MRGPSTIWINYANYFDHWGWAVEVVIHDMLIASMFRMRRKAHGDCSWIPLGRLSKGLHGLWWETCLWWCRITLSEVFDTDNLLPDGTFLSPTADYPVTRLDGRSQGQIRLALVFEEDGNDQKNLGLVFSLNAVVVLNYIKWWSTISSSGSSVLGTYSDVGSSWLCV